MPVSGTDTLDLSKKDAGFTFKVYDDGGQETNYSDYCDGYLQITAPTSCLISVSGSGETESASYDYLKFYDGSTDRSSPLGETKYGGSFTISEPLITSGEYLTIYFHSDSSINKSGYELNISVIAQSKVNYVFGDETKDVAVQKDSTIRLADFSDLFNSNDKEFISWQNCENTYNAGDEFNVSGDVTFTAVTRLMPTVTFDGNGATVIGYNGVTSYGPLPLPTGTKAPLPHANVIFQFPENKYFGGWSYNDRTYSANEEFTLTENVTFTAVWRDASAWELLGEQLNAASGTDVGTITLTEDVTAAVGSLPLTVPAGVTATIDLNGHTLDGTQAAIYGDMLTVYGNLTVTDSSADNDGELTGGGVTAYESGSFTPSGAVGACFEATLTQSYVVEDNSTNVSTENNYSVSYYPTFKGAMTAAAYDHDYKSDITTLPQDESSYRFWYNDSKVALLKDVTIAQSERSRQTPTTRSGWTLTAIRLMFRALSTAVTRELSIRADSMSRPSTRPIYRL